MFAGGCSQRILSAKVLGLEQPRPAPAGEVVAELKKLPCPRGEHTPTKETTGPSGSDPHAHEAGVKVAIGTECSGGGARTIWTAGVGPARRGGVREASTTLDPSLSIYRLILVYARDNIILWLASTNPATLRARSHGWAIKRCRTSSEVIWEKSPVAR